MLMKGISEEQQLIRRPSYMLNALVDFSPTILVSTLFALLTTQMKMRLPEVVTCLESQ